MVLTGKAGIDFIQWMDKDKRDLRKSYLDDTCYNALMVDFFDHMGIIIEVMPDFYDGWTFLPIVYDTFGNKHDIDVDYPSRQKATEVAIEKANELYNGQEKY